jgi:hypothetical protein
MPESLSPENYRLRPKEPSFLAVVILSGVVLVIFFVAAYFFVASDGIKLLPGVQPRNAEPTSQLVLPAPHERSADMQG